MSEDYKELLDQKVEDVKRSVKELEDADYQKLLNLEKEGDDRKTVKEFLEKKLEQSDYVVEEINEETEEGFLGSFDRNKVLVGGILAGLVVGLIAGFAFNMADSSNQSEIRDSLQTFYEASGTTPDTLSVDQRNGMYYASVNITQETQNGTQESSQNFYISPDGQLLFPEVQSPFLTNPYRLDDLISQAQQQQQPSGNTTQ